MFEIRCCISNINYVRSLGVLQAQFQRFHIPLGIGRAALALMPERAIQALLVKIANQYKEAILGILREFADKNGIKLNLSNLQINGGEKMIKFEIDVDNVDYKSIARFVLPLMSEKVRNNEEMSFLDELLSNRTVMDNVVSGVMDNIPEEMKNNMVKSAVECYGDKILSAINGVIRDKGIVADVSEISVQLV